MEVFLFSIVLLLPAFSTLTLCPHRLLRRLGSRWHGDRASPGRALRHCCSPLSICRQCCSRRRSSHGAAAGAVRSNSPRYFRYSSLCLTLSTLSAASAWQETRSLDTVLAACLEMLFTAEPPASAAAEGGTKTPLGKPHHLSRANFAIVKAFELIGAYSLAGLPNMSCLTSSR
jgi:hypothetical protein